MVVSVAQNRETFKYILKELDRILSDSKSTFDFDLDWPARPLYPSRDYFIVDRTTGHCDAMLQLLLMEDEIS